MIKISIIVPIFNTAKFLENCLESLANQTYNNIEIILVNDGSTDNSLEICEKYCSNDSRFKIINKSNGGSSSARNLGLSFSTGDYIGFVDSDDFVSEKMYENLLNSCILNNVKLAVCGRYKVINNKNVEMFTLSKPQIWSSKKALSNLLIWKNIDSSTCDKLFHNSLFLNHRFPEGVTTEDIYLIPSIIDLAKSIVHIGEPHYYYVYRKDSISNSKFNKNKLDILKSLNNLQYLINEKYDILAAKFYAFYITNITYLTESMFFSNVDDFFVSKQLKFFLRTLSVNYVKILINMYVKPRIKFKIFKMFFKGLKNEK
jgi:glycosyltransferase involved in cell wall biosynthesis